MSQSTVLWHIRFYFCIKRLLEGTLCFKKRKKEIVTGLILYLSRAAFDISLLYPFFNKSALNSGNFEQLQQSTKSRNRWNESVGSSTVKKFVL